MAIPRWWCCSPSSQWTTVRGPTSPSSAMPPWPTSGLRSTLISPDDDSWWEKEYKQVCNCVVFYMLRWWLVTIGDIQVCMVTVFLTIFEFCLFNYFVDQGKKPFTLRVQKHKNRNCKVCRTGYPPVETVAPEKQARANQLEVAKSSKNYFQY